MKLIQLFKRVLFFPHFKHMLCMYALSHAIILNLINNYAQNKY